ncbi:hypothetical protein M877_33495 [Streptomyces niveus NCIMB 11891]|nr:hypothetical protein M877_33495 [Streptomyces niveus NCIMB 11891]
MASRPVSATAARVPSRRSGAAVRQRAASACTIIAVTWWVTTSWSSRAIRVRSAVRVSIATRRRCSASLARVERSHAPMPHMRASARKYVTNSLTGRPGPSWWSATANGT